MNDMCWNDLPSCSAIQELTQHIISRTSQQQIIIRTSGTEHKTANISSSYFQTFSARLDCQCRFPEQHPIRTLGKVPASACDSRPRHQQLRTPSPAASAGRLVNLVLIIARLQGWYIWPIYSFVSWLITYKPSFVMNSNENKGNIAIVSLLLPKM